MKNDVVQKINNLFIDNHDKLENNNGLFCSMNCLRIIVMYQSI